MLWSIGNCYSDRSRQWGRMFTSLQSTAFLMWFCFLVTSSPRVLKICATMHSMKIVMASHWTTDGDNKVHRPSAVLASGGGERETNDAESKIESYQSRLWFHRCQKQNTYMQYLQYRWGWRSDTATILLLSGKPAEEQCDMQPSPPLPAALGKLWRMKMQHKIQNVYG